LIEAPQVGQLAAFSQESETHAAAIAHCRRKDATSSTVMSSMSQHAMGLRDDGVQANWCLVLRLQEKHELEPLITILG
jgi:hypothetical protein